MPDAAISGRQLRIRRGLSRVPAASCEIATAPAEPRNDKLEGLPNSQGRNDKLESPLQGPLGSRRNFFSFPLARSMV